MGFGEFYANTPKGRVDFDRMRGKDFPGQSGRSHQLYGDPQAAADWLVEEMEKKGKSERMASGATEKEAAGPVGAPQAAIMEYLSKAAGPVALTEMTSHPLFRGIHFGKVMKAAEVLAKKGQIRYFSDPAKMQGYMLEKTAASNEAGLRSATIRLAASLPKGSDERKALLAALLKG